MHFIAGLAAEEKDTERNWKSGDRDLGGSFSALPSAKLSKSLLFQLSESYTSKMTLLVPNLPFSTKSIDSASLQPLILLQAQGNAQFRLSLRSF